MTDAEIATFEEFLAAAARHFGYSDERARSPFPSRESGTAALRRWWGDVVGLEVAGGGAYRWRCPQCGQDVSVEGEPVHTWPMFEYVLWGACSTCSERLRGEVDE